ncbi:MAG: DUF2163 domain-containing protein [Alphaproteobacteria bacterium]|nr:DUF2163 domain-containing protein [Alphaproteobacteria bacterium]
MKTLPSGLQDHLDSGATTLCWCWKLTRADDTAQGFTDHDEPFTFDGLTYAATTGITASEVQSTAGLAVDNLTVIGALDAASLNESDLAAGLYDDAGIEIWRVNWATPAQRVLMRKGNLGEIKRGKTGFHAEVRGLAHRLNQPVGRVFAYSCDADLGDARCTKDISGSTFTATATIATVTDNRRFTAAALAGYDSGWFTGGLVTFTSGANATRRAQVKRHCGTSLELWHAPSEPLAIGDAFTVTAGCDKQFATCKSKFTNGVNFRGFPYLPGNDALIAAPQQPLDGGSRYGH